MNRDWELKQQLSTKTIVHDDIYTTAMAHGALAGRICGAGNGGTYYFYCRPGKKEDILAALKEKPITLLSFRIQRPEEIGGWYQT